MIKNSLSIPTDLSEHTKRVLYEAFAKFFGAYLECDVESQQMVQDMAQVINDPDTTDAERKAAIRTISEVLFPAGRDGFLGVNLMEDDAAEPETVQRMLREMDQEEETFSQKLAQLMKDRGLNQNQLAELIGVGQPAISMMLARNCRPQKRTVEKIAEALGVSPRDLWPTWGE